MRPQCLNPRPTLLSWLALLTRHGRSTRLGILCYILIALDVSIITYSLNGSRVMVATATCLVARRSAPCGSRSDLPTLVAFGG